MILPSVSSLLDLEELIEQLFTATADLRRRETSGSGQSEPVARTFRCLHSIRGLAASAGFLAAAELAHQAEFALDAVRSGRIEISTALIDTLEDVAYAISEELNPDTNRRLEPATGLLVQRLLTLAEHAVSSPARGQLFDLPAEIADSLNEREKQVLLGSLHAHARLCLVTADFEVANFDTEFQRLRETLARYGEVVCALPSAEGLAPNHIAFRLFFTSKLSASEVQDRLGSSPEATVTGLSLPSLIEPDAEAQRGPFVVRVRAPSSPSGFIRLELGELERLRTSAHEVFEQIVAALDLVSTSLTGDARTELSNLDAQVRQSLAALEETIVELRTISVNRVFQRAIVAGRVAARSAGKEVEFSVSGSDLRIDKVHSDAIAAPLLHLVRNAVDHGIETPAERTAAGKKPIGTVRVEASATGDEVRFAVSDDGRGIDAQVISLAAADRGLIEKDTVLDKEQSLRLIFRPGFSTAEAKSNLSGCGVGLEVVEHSVKQVGGSVSVQTRTGKGSEFELRLPRNRLQPG